MARASQQQCFWGVLHRAWQQQMVRAVWTPSLLLGMFTCLNLTSQPASFILSWPVPLWLSCGFCCSTSWLPQAGGLLLAPSLQRMLALLRSWASESSLLEHFIFKTGYAALGTGGSLVLSSLVSLSIYFAVDFRKSFLAPLQPTAIFPLTVIAPKWRSGLQRCSLAISEGTVPFSASVFCFRDPSGVVGMYFPILLISLCSGLGFPELAFIPLCLRMKWWSLSASERLEGGRGSTVSVRLDRVCFL